MSARCCFEPTRFDPWSNRRTAGFPAATAPDRLVQRNAEAGATWLTVVCATGKWRFNGFAKLSTDPAQKIDNRIRRPGSQRRLWLAQRTRLPSCALVVRLTYVPAASPFTEPRRTELEAWEIELRSAACAGSSGRQRLCSAVSPDRLAARPSVERS